MAKIAVLLAAGCLFAACACKAGGVDMKTGDLAPDFTLAASDGRTYRLSEYRDKQAVIIAWFPKAHTPG